MGDYLDIKITDETVVEEYSKDPLCGFTFTINGFQNVFQLNKE